MKIYVAGKYEEKEKVRGLYFLLEEAGHTITMDWTYHEIEPDDPDMEAKLARYAVEDITGVQKCDVFIALMLNDYHYKGLWVEMGGALALDKPVYIIGDAEDSIFTNHPLVRRFQTVGDCIQHIG